MSKRQLLRLLICDN